MQPEPGDREGTRFSGQGTNRNFYLPRLIREHYQGDAVVHWTMPIALRGTVRFPSPLNGERDQGRGVRMQDNA